MPTVPAGSPKPKCIRCKTTDAKKSANRKGGAMKFKLMCAKCLTETLPERKAANFPHINQPATTGPIRRHLDRIPSMLDRIEKGTAPADFPALIKERIERARMRVAALDETKFSDVKVDFNAKLDSFEARAKTMKI